MNRSQTTSSWAANDAGHSEGEGESLLDAQRTPRWSRAVEPVARWAAPEDEEWAVSGRLRFLQAGLRSPSAPLVFYAVKVLLVVTLPLVGWAVLQSTGALMGGLGWSLILLALAALGFYAPQVWLSHRVAQRQQQLFEAFPDAIDLMIVCVESGLGLDLALDRVGRELALRCPALSEELAWVSSELRLGSARARALRQLADRTGVEEVRLFVAVLLQADRFGVSIADSMRVHAQTLRGRRQLRAEEAASKLPLKLLFPLILTLFPALMVVLMGPAAIHVIRQMMPNLGAG